MTAWLLSIQYNIPGYVLCYTKSINILKHICIAVSKVLAKQVNALIRSCSMFDVKEATPATAPLLILLLLFRPGTGGRSFWLPPLSSASSLLSPRTAAAASSDYWLRPGHVTTTSTTASAFRRVTTPVLFTLAPPLSRRIGSLPFAAAASPTLTATAGTRTGNNKSIAMSLRRPDRKATATATPATAVRGGGGSSSSSALHAAVGGGGSRQPAAVTAVFDGAPFWASQRIFLAVNLLGYVLNLLMPTLHYHVDLLGTGAFAVAAIYPTLKTTNRRVRLSAGCVTAWSVKLASFLLYRVILKGGHDNRLDDVLSSPVYSAGFWMFSLLWGVLCSLPHVVGSTSSSPGNPLATKIGAAVFGAGWIIETAADYQKWIFKKTHDPSDFCNVGLWSVSQHPNWFGNLVLWAGILIMNAPALVEPAPARKKGGIGMLAATLWRYRRVGVTLLSPLFMLYLFYSQATGRILPDAHQANYDKYGYGTDPSFTQYVDATPLIVPLRNPLQWL